MNLEGDEMNLDADVIIVGTGLAGLYCALHIREDLDVILLTHSKIDDCNSYLAQGGITTVLDESDKRLFIEDTLKAGMYKNSLEAVETVADEARENIQILQDIGVRFDKTDKGFHYTAEGGHSANRIVHCADKTGKEVFETVLKYVQGKNNIKIYDNTLLVDIITNENKCRGVLVLKDKKPQRLYGNKTVLATGGIGGLFKKSTNQRGLKGVAIAIALRHDITIKDTEFIQYHPTGLYDPSHQDKYFLISESLRGEGAKLLNTKGNRFIDELQPRNVVTKAMLEEQKATKSEFQYLDISFKEEGFLRNRFPLIYKECMERGIDITKQPIPVTPVQHYAMGGIKVDLDGLTSMENLYACGECSCTGLHGGNRMASNSLLEALVFSRRAAKHINDSIELNHFKENPNIFNQEVTVEEVQRLYQENEVVIIEHIKKIRGDLIYELVYN